MQLTTEFFILPEIGYCKPSFLGVLSKILAICVIVPKAVWTGAWAASQGYSSCYSNLPLIDWTKLTKATPLSVLMVQEVAH